jgi:RNase H-fold protein (predicted Holliday junction resolvase)
MSYVVVLIGALTLCSVLAHAGIQTVIQGVPTPLEHSQKKTESIAEAFQNHIYENRDRPVPTCSTCLGMKKRSKINRTNRG